MWLEIKAATTIIAAFIFAIIMGLSGNFIFVILTIMGLATHLFGDLLLGYKLVQTDAIQLLDPVGPNEKLAFLHLISGRLRILKSTKGPQGTWRFMYNKHKVSIIEKGRGTYRTTNGNPLFHCHEAYDKTIDPVETKYFEGGFHKNNVDNSFDLYDSLKEKEGE